MRKATVWRLRILLIVLDCRPWSDVHRCTGAQARLALDHILPDLRVRILWQIVQHMVHLRLVVLVVQAHEG